MDYVLPPRRGKRGVVVAWVRYDRVIYLNGASKTLKNQSLVEKRPTEEIDLDDGHVNAQPLCADVPWHIGGFSTETEESEVTSI